MPMFQDKYNFVPSQDLYLFDGRKMSLLFVSIILYSVNIQKAQQNPKSF